MQTKYVYTNEPRPFSDGQAINWLLKTRQDGDCWRWAGPTTRDGYGIVAFRREGRCTSTTAHRAIYEILVGAVPEGLELDHLCRSRSCVNPEHLEPVTHEENLLRARQARRVEEVCP